MTQRSDSNDESERANESVLRLLTDLEISVSYRDLGNIHSTEKGEENKQMHVRNSSERD